MEISSVVFDYGSVLAWPPSYENGRRVARAAGMSASQLLDRYYLERSAYDRDTIDDIEYWRRITEGLPIARDDARLAELAALDVEIWSDPNRSALDWLPRLKEAGITLAILSNMPQSFCTALERRDRWLDIFDHRIFSGRVKLNKPEPAMYRLLIDTLQDGTRHCRPGNILFLDDLEANVVGARALGINAELYNVFDGGLASIAERYGLPIPTEHAPPRSRLEDFAFAPHRQPT